MKKIIRLTEQDLVKLVKRVINESDDKLDKLLDILLSKYNLPKNKYAIFGSAPLLVKGMINDINDLDVIVKPKYWPFGEEDSHRTKEIEFFKSWPGFNVNDLINNHSFNYKGFKFINPDKVLDYKKELKRDKDKDIWNLTEGQLIRLVKRVINEDDDESKLIDLLTSKDIDNVKLGLILYDSQDIKVDSETLYKAKENVILDYCRKLGDSRIGSWAKKIMTDILSTQIERLNMNISNPKKKDEANIKQLESKLNSWFVEYNGTILKRSRDTLAKELIKHWDKIKDEVLYS